MDVLTSETSWTLNNEIIKQETSSWSLFIQVEGEVYVDEKGKEMESSDRNVKLKPTIVLHRRSDCGEWTDSTLRSLPQRSSIGPASPPYSLGRILAGTILSRLSLSVLCTCTCGRKKHVTFQLCVMWNLLKLWTVKFCPPLLFWL